MKRISVQRQIEISGTLLSPDQARVSSEAPGVVRDVLIDLGSEVKPGDVLVRLDTREAALAVERAESALRQTQAQLGMANGNDVPLAEADLAAVRQAEANRDDARNNLERVERLVDRGLLPQVERDNAQTKLKVAEANYQAALDNARSLRASLQDRRASVDLARKKMNDGAIRAPVGGAISERLVHPGEFIQQNTPVVTIVQVNPLKLRTAVQEKYASLIRPDLPVKFRVEPFRDSVFEGKVAYVSPAVDQATRTFPIEAMVDNKDRRLKPGFFAKGTVETRVDENVLAVPEDAVSTLAGVSAVFVVENGQIRQQQVTLGPRQGDLFEVVQGLKGDEVLAITNLSMLATGTPVTTGEGGGAPGGEPGRGARSDAGKPGREEGAR